MGKLDTINFITTNCHCWQGKGDKEVLNTFSTQKLENIKEGIVQRQKLDKIADAIRNGLAMPNLSIDDMEPVVNTKLPVLVANMVQVENKCKSGGGAAGMGEGKDEEESLENKAKSKKDMEDEEEPDGDEFDYEENSSTGLSETTGTTDTVRGTAATQLPSTSPVKTTTKNQHTNEDTKVTKPQTVNEWLATAPSQVQRAVSHALKLEAASRANIIGKLVANVRNEEVKKQTLAILNSKSLEELQIMEQAFGNLGAPVSNDRPDEIGNDYFADYSAAAPSLSANTYGTFNADLGDDDVLIPQRLEFTQAK